MRRHVGAGEVGAAAAHAVVVAGVAVDALQVVRRSSPCARRSRVAVGQRVLDVAALEVRAAAGAGVAAQAHRALGQRDPLGHRVEARLVLPEDRLPRPVAAVVLVEVAAVAGGVADQAVDVLELLAATSPGSGSLPSPAWHFEQPCAITVPSLLSTLPIQLAAGLVQKSFIVLSLPSLRPSGVDDAPACRPATGSAASGRSASASSSWHCRQVCVPS